MAGSKKRKRWSADVNATSDALDVKSGTFNQRSARRIALSLKTAAERSKRRKASPFQSAMSMLNFYINRGGKNIRSARRAVLNRAKNELRELFGRT